MIRDLGLINGSCYRTVLECDVQSCGNRFSLDIDKFYVEGGSKQDIRRLNIEQFLEYERWTTVTAPHGVTKHFCAEHAPKL